MSVDKLVDSTQLDADLTSVANAIRAKSGGSGQLAFPAGFVSEIGNIPSGGGGGASNVVTGTFKGTTGNTSLDITLNYSGNGYPIMVVIMPAEGASNDNGTFYNTMQRYAVNSYIVTKSYIQTPPDYNKTATADEAVGIYRYKSSATSATTYSVNSTSTTSLYSDEDPTNNAAGCVRIRSATKMSVRIASSQYGFMVDIDYKYAVIYSS